MSNMQGNHKWHENPCDSILITISISSVFIELKNVIMKIITLLSIGVNVLLL